MKTALLFGWFLGIGLAAVHAPSPEARPARLPQTRPAAVAAQSSAEAAWASRVVHLPALENQGSREACEVEIDVQNIGGEASKAVLLVWGLPVACGRFEAGLYNVACSGLLAPGASWTFEARQVPLGAYSGRLYSFNARRLSEIGADVENRFDDLVADLLCERLFVDAVGDEAALSAFQAALESGGRYWSLPLDRVLGGELLARVQRACPGDQRPGLEVVSSYAGIRGDALASDPDPSPAGRHLVQLPAASVDPEDGSTSIVYVQNPGLACIEPTLTLIDQDDCTRRTDCASAPVSPGESVAVDLRGCVEAGWAGQVEVSAQGPIAVLIDRIGQDGFWSYAGSSAGGPGRLPGEEGAPVDTELVAALPIAAADASRIETLVSVSALGGGASARVQVEILDPDGRPIFAEERELCQGRSIHRWSRNIDPGAEDVAGQVRIQSRPSILEPEAAAPPITAILEQRRFAGDVPEQLQSALAFSLERTPSSEKGGPALLALPRMRVDPQRRGSNSDILLGNTRLEDGQTDAAIVFFDQNGQVDAICSRLRAGESQAIGVSRLPMASSGFKGTALVSAIAWSHQDMDGRPVVGLAATILDRSGAGRATDDLGGDRAIALPRSVGATLGLGAYRPPCPGHAPPLSLPNRPAPDPRFAQRADAALALLHLPAMNQLAEHLDCIARIEVWNEGEVPALIVVPLQAGHDSCPPDCAQPVGIACSGLLAPGRSWNFEADDALLAARSGRMFSLRALRMDQVGGAANDRRLAAEVLCEALRDPLDRFGACESQRRLFEAFLGGLRYLDIPFDALVGPPLRAEVVRECRPDRRNPLQIGALSVNGAIAHQQVDRAARRPDGRYVYAVPRLDSDAEGAFSTIHVQNAGTSCAGVELRLYDAGERERYQTHRVLQTSPGFSQPVGMDVLKGISWSGSAEIHSSAPLALSIDRVFSDHIDSSLARPGPLSFDLNGDGREDLDDVAALEALLGRSEGMEGWNPIFDLDGNRRIDDADLAWLRLHVDPSASPTEAPSPSASPTEEGTPATRTPATHTPSPIATATPTEPVRLFLPTLALGALGAPLARRASLASPRGHHAAPLVAR